MPPETLDGFSQTRLILAISSDIENKLHTKLNFLCHTFWRTNPQIKVITFPHPKDSSNIAAGITAELKHSKQIGLSGRVIYVKQLKLTDAAKKNLKKLNPTIREVWATELWEGVLSEELRAMQLTWEALVLNKLKYWVHGEITKDSLREWCKQFDRLAGDSHLWVGEALLKGINIYSSNELSTAFLRVAKNPSGANTRCCILRYKNGKSADALSSIIYKKFSSHCQKDVEINNWLEVIHKPITDYSQSYLVFEDGLFTGTETADILLTLVGLAKKKDILQLEDLKLLRKISSEFIFVVATDVGLAHLNAAIKATGANITIRYDKMIKTLTEIGSKKLENNSLYEADINGRKFVRSTNDSLCFGIFDDVELFPEEAQKNRAIELCRKLGKSLWETYLARKGKSWSNEQIEFCSLGAGQMALATVFAHSVPKSNLPVYWCHGQAIDRNGLLFDWKPLFPEAHPI
jgi:hypothetical protein